MEEAVIPGANQRNFGLSAKQKLYQFLCSRPAGADASELVGLLLSGVGSDPELGARLVRQLIGDDPNFIFDADTAQWRLAQSDRLRVGTRPGRVHRRRSRNHRRPRRSRHDHRDRRVPNGWSAAHRHRSRSSVRPHGGDSRASSPG